MGPRQWVGAHGKGLSNQGQAFFPKKKPEAGQASQMTQHFRALLIMSIGSQELKINTWQDSKTSPAPATQLVSTFSCLPSCLKVRPVQHLEG